MFNEAVIAFVGKGRSASPATNWNAAAGRFGDDTREAVEAVVSYLDGIAVDWTAEEWEEADSRVRTILAAAYPGLDTSALDSLVRKFDYDWK